MVSQLPYKCYLEEHPWEIDLRFARGLPPGWGMPEIGDNFAVHESQKINRPQLSGPVGEREGEVATSHPRG